jgi:glutamyl-tRNA synthetase
MIENFTLDRVNRAPASFDPQKLMAFQDRYMREFPLDEKVTRSIPYLAKAGLVETPVADDIVARIREIHDAAGDRIKVSGDILDYAYFFVADDDLQYQKKAFDKWVRNPVGADKFLQELRDELASIDPFDVAHLDEHVRRIVNESGVKMGHAMQLLRVATTGTGVGFGLIESLSILGKQRSLARIDRALSII